MAFKFRFNKNALTISYKLLNDLFFLALVFFTLALVADGVIPGIVSDHISFLKITVIIVANLFAIYIFGNYAEIKIKNQKISKTTAGFFIVLAVLIIFNSLYRLNITLAVFILIATSVAGYFTYKNILES